MLCIVFVHTHAIMSIAHVCVTQTSTSARTAAWATSTARRAASTRPAPTAARVPSSASRSTPSPARKASISRPTRTASFPATPSSSTIPASVRSELPSSAMHVCMCELQAHFAANMYVHPVPHMCVNCVFLAGVQCPSVPDLVNGAVLTTETRFNFADEVTFLCDLGFMPTGARTISCQSDGQWSVDPSTFTCSRESIQYAL